jgi:hypothetical protein
LGEELMRKAKMAAIAADRDAWMKKATEASIAAAKDVIGAEGPIRPSVPIGRLTESEWGWICSSVVWAWIATRSAQAATEGWDSERAVRTTGLAPDPWVAGAVASILSKLFEACSDLDWSVPVGSWSKDAIVEFLMAAVPLIERAVAARDVSEEKIAGKTNADVTARRMNAAAGGPQMTIQELDGEASF